MSVRRSFTSFQRLSPEITIYESSVVLAQGFCSPSDEKTWVITTKTSTEVCLYHNSSERKHTDVYKW